MKYSIIGSKLREGQFYPAVITRHVDTKDKLRVYFQFEAEERIEYLKSIHIDCRKNSQFVKFCEEMQIVDKKGNIQTDELDGRAVLATLRRGEDNCMYISKVKIDFDYYEQYDDKGEEEE